MSERRIFVMANFVSTLVGYGYTGNVEPAYQMNPGAVAVATVVSLLLFIANWKLFAKAGEAGWKSLIPIYSSYIYFKIVYGNGWKFLLLLVPILNIVFEFGFNIRLAQAYGKSVAFGIGLILLNPIFMLMLAFGDSSYRGSYHGFV